MVSQISQFLGSFMKLTFSMSIYQFYSFIKKNQWIGHLFYSVRSWFDFQKKKTNRWLKVGQYYFYQFIANSLDCTIFDCPFNLKLMTSWSS